MKASLFAALAAVLAMSHSAHAAELLATLSTSKSEATDIWLEIASDGTVAGFSFALDVGASGAAEVRTSDCVARLPKGFNAACTYRNGQIKVIAFAELPGTFLRQGKAPVGSVTVSTVLTGDRSVRVYGFETSGDDGGSTRGTAKTVFQLAP